MRSTGPGWRPTTAIHIHSGGGKRDGVYDQRSAFVDHGVQRDQGVWTNGDLRRTEFTSSGLQGGDSVSTVNLSSAGAVATAGQGSYDILTSSASAAA